MIRQVVTIRWAEGTGAGSVAAFAEALEKFFAATGEAASYWHGPDLGLGPSTWDYAVVADFPDAAAWERFHDHPAHDPTRDVLARYAAERAAVRFAI